MNKKTKNPWILGARVGSVILIAILAITIVMAKVIAPTEAHKQAMQLSIDIQHQILETGMFDSEKAPVADDVQAAGYYVARVENINVVISTVLVVASVLAGHRYIRSRSIATKVEPVVTLAVATPFIIGGIVAPIIINRTVGTNHWLDVTLASWVFWAMTIVSAIVTLLVVGAAAHILERRYKRKHSFEIE